VQAGSHAHAARREMRKYEILLVDDDPSILEALGPVLEACGYEVTRAGSGEEAIDILEGKCIDLVITDLVMGAVDGIEVLRRAKHVNSDAIVIILTGFGDVSSAVEALRLRADDYLLKPCAPRDMGLRVSRCFEALELRRRIKLHETILPVCCVCKKIRDDAGKEPGTGEWMTVEKYMWTKAHIAPSGTYCPECLRKTREEIEQQSH